MEIPFKYPKLIKFFEEISAIPRGSYNEKAIADYLVNFAKARDFDYYRDESHNVLINIAATVGKENSPALLIQGHTDMVCEKNANVSHDFQRDGLRLYVDEEGKLRAEGTTLGADNGVAVALMLYLLDGGFSAHPACQCLFTAAEEVGLDGAKAFDYSRIFAKRLINVDSPEESTVVIGCAGGERYNVTFSVERENGSACGIEITVGGLCGGHSGEDIHRGRANACKIMGRILICLEEKFEFRIVSLSGGSKENAIPRECTVTIASGEVQQIQNEIAALEKIICDELVTEDKGFFIKTEQIEAENPLSFRDSVKLTGFVSGVFAGVLAMNENIPGVVEYSRNLGIIKTEEEKITITLSSRSAMDSRIDLSAMEIESFARQFGGKVSRYNRYPGWIYSGKTALEEEYTTAFRKIYGNAPFITAIHAGLECGIITAAIPGLEAISVGPNVSDLHSPRESLDLASFERFTEVFGKFLEL